MLGESAVSCVVFVGGDSFFYRMRGSCNVGCIVIWDVWILLNLTVLMTVLLDCKALTLLLLTNNHNPLPNIKFPISKLLLQFLKSSKPCFVIFINFYLFMITLCRHFSSHSISRISYQQRILNIFHNDFIMIFSFRSKLLILIITSSVELSCLVYQTDSCWFRRCEWLK